MTTQYNDQDSKIQISEKQMTELVDFDEPKVFLYVAKLRDDNGDIISQKCKCGGFSKDFRQHIKGKQHLKFCKDNHINVVVPLKNNNKTADMKTYRAKYMRKYLSVNKNREKQKQYNRNYRKNNLKKCLAAQKKCRDNNKQKLEEKIKLNKKLITFTDEEMELIKNTSKELGITAPHLSRFILEKILKWGDVNECKNVNRVDFWVDKYSIELENQK